MVEWYNVSARQLLPHGVPVFLRFSEGNWEPAGTGNVVLYCGIMRVTEKPQHENQEFCEG
ncbi:MAG: hypothetical protein OHK0029_36750 [Armatimonadaceae bacterium]